MKALFDAFVNEGERSEKGDQGAEDADDDGEDDPPFDLALLMARAIDLDELHQVGASFAYPDSLTLEEWVALRQLQAARRKIEGDLQQRQKDDAEMREREQRLKTMTGRT